MSDTQAHFAVLRQTADPAVVDDLVENRQNKRSAAA